LDFLFDAAWGESWAQQSNSAKKDKNSSARTGKQGNNKFATSKSEERKRVQNFQNQIKVGLEQN